MNKVNHSQLANLIWSMADSLPSDFKQSKYGRIILSFTLLKIVVRSCKAPSTLIVCGESAPARASA